jgi:hypothetical protein
MPSKRNWEVLLRFIYEHDESWENFGIGQGGLDDSHPFVTDTGLSVHQAESALSFLKRHELVDSRNTDFFQLSTKGFEVIRDQDFKRDQTRNNQAIVAFTIVLAIISVLDIVATEITPDSLIGQVALAALVIIILVGILLLASEFLAEH